MKGRLEHELRTKKNIEVLLSEMPEYVSEFYYNIQISKEPNTCVEYLRKIKLFLDFANCNIKDIDDTIIGKYFDKINYTKDKDNNINKSTFAYRQATWTALNQLFTYLCKKKIIDNNPMETTERPKNTDKIKRIFLKVEDLNAILEATQTGAGNQLSVARQKKWKERDLLILYLFMNTGMRKTALSEINISDISFKNKELTVTDKRNKEHIYNITDDMEYLIKEWLVKREELLGNNKSNDALFISQTRKRISERAVYDIVKKYSEEALGYSINPHKFRSSFISLNYEQKGDIKAICEAVGHASIATTSRYITQRNNSRKDAQNFMANALKIKKD